MAATLKVSHKSQNVTVFIKKFGDTPHSSGFDCK